MKILYLNYYILIKNYIIEIFIIKNKNLFEK